MFSRADYEQHLFLTGDLSVNPYVLERVTEAFARDDFGVLVPRNPLV